jgi:hypothetical protein
LRLGGSEAIEIPAFFLHYFAPWPPAKPQAAKKKNRTTYCFATHGMMKTSSGAKATMNLCSPSRERLISASHA